MKFKYTEDAIRGRIVEWINEIIREENLPFDRADAQIEIEGRKFPDIVLWKKRLLEGALLIELKRPFYDPWEVAGEALEKSTKTGIRFFATWNMNKFLWWDNYRKGDLYDKLCGPVDVTKIRDVDEFDRAERYIKDFLRKFLKEFSEIYTGLKRPPLLPLDERFITRLRSAVEAFSLPVFNEFKRRVCDPDFRIKLMKWFSEQGYVFQASRDEDFERISRQYVYLLIDKIIFYNTLAFKHKWLPKISIRPGLTGEEFRKSLQTFFDEASREIDYETIFAANFLDTIPPPDDLVESLRRFIEEIERFDLSKIGYDVLGRVFERLIPDHERHKLGQYYTRSDVVDVITGFCVKSADDKVFDPACGAGTFLIRSYERKRFLDPSRTHEELLKELWGNDIAKFPSHLATINLACKDLSVERSYPIIICRDFFDLRPGEPAVVLPYEVKGLDESKMQVKLPFFDSVVTNPPYTRQEEMEGLVFHEGYRDRLQKQVAEEWNGFYIGKRSSIYAYFFFHGAKFLKEGGRLGLITSNSWLDVDYGKYLQRFFLENFKIIAVIESKVERWFEDADVNTCITILEKCSKKKERDRNLVKFVQLKKPLDKIISSTGDERERWLSVDEFVQFVENTDEYYEDNRLRVFVISQEKLWREGLDEESGDYVGSKWGKYIRAPDIFFKILEKGKDLFVPLKEIADVRRGFTTGANEFFYLPKPGESNKFFKAEMNEDTGDLILLSKKSGEEMFRIEKEYWMHKIEGDVKELRKIYEFVYVDSDGNVWIPNYVVKSPQEVKKIIIEPKDLKNVVLMVHEDKEQLKGKNVLKYIEWGESQGYHTRPTCSSRKVWYNVGIFRSPQLFWFKAFNDRVVVPMNTFNVLNSDRFYSIYLKEGFTEYLEIVGAYFNSTLNCLVLELSGRVNLGQGALDNMTYEAANVLTIHPKRIKGQYKKRLKKHLSMLSSNTVESVFEEIRANTPEEVSLDKVKPDRRELDKIVMGEILGLTEEEQLEVYRAVIDLVKSRIEKARSVQKKKKVKGIDLDTLVNSVMNEIDIEMGRFPDDYVDTSRCKELTVPEGKPEIKSNMYGFFVRVGDEDIKCENPYEANYIYYAILNGNRRIKIPTDKRTTENAVKRYQSVLRDAKRKLETILETTVPDKKLRKRIEDIIWDKLLKGEKE